MVLQRFAENPNHPLRRHIQTQHFPHQRSLSRTGTSYQGKDFSAMNAKIDIFMHHMAAEPCI
jgi:hypothetical protein